MRKFTRGLYTGWPLLAACLILLSGCRPEPAAQTPDNAVMIYYAEPQEANYSPNVLRPVELSMEENTGDALDFAIRAVLSPPGPEQSPFPASVKLNSYQMEDHLLTIDLSEPYGRLSGTQLTIADACMILTACQIKGVTGVRITVDGKPHPAREDRSYTASDFVLGDLNVKTVEREITLYFADSENRFVWPEKRNIVIREDESLERYIVQELIKGPKNKELNPVMPEESLLIGVSTDAHGVCTLHFSAGFLNIERFSTAGMTLAALVNSLTELSEVGQVQCLVAGEPVTQYGPYKLSGPMTRNPDAIGEADSREATLYYLDADRDWTIPVAVRMAYDSSRSEAYTVLESLLSLPPPDGLASDIPENTQISSFSISEGLCRISLTERELPIQAVACIVNTLTDLEEIRAVEFWANGSRNRRIHRDEQPFYRMTQYIND